MRIVPVGKFPEELADTCLPFLVSRPLAFIACFISLSSISILVRIGCLYV
jgi:hypothetical protein